MESKAGMWLQGLHARAGCPAYAQLIPKGKQADLAAGYAAARTSKCVETWQSIGMQSVSSGRGISTAPLPAAGAQIAHEELASWDCLHSHPYLTTILRRHGHDKWEGWSALLQRAHCACVAMQFYCNAPVPHQLSNITEDPALVLTKT